MPLTAAGGSKDPSRLTQWVQHHPVSFLAMPLTLDIVNELALRDISGGWFWLSWLVSGVSITLFFIFLSSEVKHMRGFCQTCFHQPLGGPQVAEKRRSTLKAAHWYSAHIGWLSIFFIIFLLVSSFLSKFGTAAVILGNVVPFYGMLMWSSNIVRVHQWLAPWCPWCKGGGYQEPSPDPVPEPSGTKLTTA